MQQARWHAQLEELTRPYRERRAKALTAEGVRLRHAAASEHRASLGYLGREPGVADPLVRLQANDPAFHGVGLWHLQRARGQRERFKRVDRCEIDDMIEIDCGYCGHAVKRPRRCRTALVCLSC